MRSWIPVAITLTALLRLTSTSFAGETDSLRWHMQQWQLQNEKHRLSDSGYIRKVDSVIFQCFDRPDFPQLMEHYRNIVFGDTAFKERRIVYFQYRGIHSVNNESQGQAIFYFSKMAEIAKNQHNAARELAAHRAMISIFVDNKDAENCFKLYNTVLPLIRAQIDSAAVGRSTPMMMENVSGILMAMINLYYREKRFPQAHDCETLLNRVMQIVNGSPEKYKRFLGKIRVSAAEAAFAKAAYDLRDPQLAGQAFNDLLQKIHGSGMPEPMQAFFLYDGYNAGIEFFMDARISDSALKYLHLLDQLDLPMIRIRKQQFFHEQMGILLNRNGRHEEAYEHNARALALKDSVLKATRADRDNNVYAQTQAEYNQELLSRSQKAQSKAEMTTTLLILLIITKTILVIGFFFWYRQKQRNRFLNAKLRMARNIHDEIGPLLLYVKLMSKKEKEHVSDSPYLAQMDGALNNVMETVRGLSHDLKSNKELTTMQLHDELKALLEKTEALTGIRYQFFFNNKDKPLNYFQYQHLRNILTELVNNTIKHAEWSHINLMLRILPQKISIVYTDNGLGFEPAYEQKNGIGLANIRERVEKLHGQLDLRNNYPEGYTIEINIPFE